jgi:hypothetical protein
MVSEKDLGKTTNKQTNKNIICKPTLPQKHFREEAERPGR